MDAETRNDDHDEQVVRGTDAVLLDVRPIIERGEEPFGTIMQTVASLDGRSLLLVAPFEPTPLQGVLSAQGFSYRSERVSETEWRVRFDPGEDPGTAPPGAPTSAERASAERASADGALVDRAPTGDASPYTITRRMPTGTAPTGSSPAATGTGTRPPTTGPTSMTAMNPTMNVPPAWLPLGFMAAAGIGLVGFGSAAVLVAPTVVVNPQDDHVIAATHLGVLAFLSTAVLGALHQFGPVVGGRPLRSVPLGALTAALFVPGAWLIPIGFATGHLGIVQAGGVLATVAVCIAAWNLSRPLGATGKGAPIVGLRMAVAYLVGTAAFGIVYAFNKGAFWFDPGVAHRVLAHAHLGLLGWLGLAYVAVAEKLWPMFLLAHRRHVRDGERAVWLVGSGAPVLTVGLLWPSRVLAVAGAAIVAAGLVSHLMSLASVIRHRRRGLELLHGFVLGSAAFLVVAMVLATVAGLAPMSVATRSRLAAAEVLSLVLWLALAVIGHAHKIVPFISWNRLRDRGITTGRDGRPLLFAHLVNRPTASITLGLALLGASAGVLGLVSSTVPLVRIAGVALALSGLTAVLNLVSGPLLMIRWHERQVAPTAVEGVAGSADQDVDRP